MKSWRDITNRKWKMIMRTSGLILFASLLAGCSHAPQPGDPEFSTVGFLKDHDATKLSDIVLIPESAEAINGKSLPFNSKSMWVYVTRYAPTGNDCPDGQFDSDCDNFQSHALAAAGIKINKPSAACTKGMSIRVKDLALAFDNASRRYHNIIKFTDYHQAKRGDFCFLPRIPGGINDHMMLLDATPDPQGAFVWSHTNNRIGTHAPFDPARCVFYRIQDKP